MRGLRTDRTASTVIRGHAFMQNLRRGHYELGVEARDDRLRVASAFDELARRSDWSPNTRALGHALDDSTQQCPNNRIEWDHGRLKARLRPMRGLRTDRTASTVIRGHPFIQNLRRGHYELGIEARHEHLRLAAAFDELTPAI